MRGRVLFPEEMPMSMKTVDAFQLAPLSLQALHVVGNDELSTHAGPLPRSLVSNDDLYFLRILTSSQPANP